MILPFSFAVKNRPRNHSNAVKARNLLKKLLAALPPKTTAEIREQGKLLAVKP